MWRPLGPRAGAVWFCAALRCAREFRRRRAWRCMSVCSVCVCVDVCMLGGHHKSFLECISLHANGVYIYVGVICVCM